MTSIKKIAVALLVVSLAGFSATALTACSEDDITSGDAEEQVSVVLRDFDITPERAEVAEGEIEFVVNNEGERVHELAIRAPDGTESTGEIEPGETGRMTVDLPPGSYRIYDPRSDYRDRGMDATVVVTGKSATVTERTVERTVVEEEDPDVEVPEAQEPEVQEPEVQEPEAQAPPPPPTVTQVVPAPRPPPAETTP